MDEGRDPRRMGEGAGRRRKKERVRAVPGGDRARQRGRQIKERGAGGGAPGARRRPEQASEAPGWVGAGGPQRTGRRRRAPGVAMRDSPWLGAVSRPTLGPAGGAGRAAASVPPLASPGSGGGTAPAAALGGSAPRPRGPAREDRDGRPPRLPAPAGLRADPLPGLAAPTPSPAEPLPGSPGRSAWLPRSPLPPPLPPPPPGEAATLPRRPACRRCPSFPATASRSAGPSRGWGVREVPAPPAQDPGRSAAGSLRLQLAWEPLLPSVARLGQNLRLRREPPAAHLGWSGGQGSQGIPPTLCVLRALLFPFSSPQSSNTRALTMGSSVRPGDGGGVGGREGLGWAPWQTGGRVRGSGSSWKGVRCWEQVLSLVVAVCPLGTSFLPLPLVLAEGGSRTPIGPHNLILDIRPFLRASPTLPRVWMGSEDPVRPPQEG